jgi:diguanylate cyclase (GGDEF)-like protein/PAS domain S-box-containing protein
METQDWVPDHGAQFSPSGPSSDIALGQHISPVDASGADRRDDLKLAPEDLEEAFAIARMGVWRWRVGTSEFVWSRELFRIAGRDPKAFAPSLENTLACIHEDDREHIRARLLAAVESFDAMGREFRIIRPDGCERHCWARISPISRDGRVVAIRGVLLDLTERRLADIALQASEEHYRNTVELSPQMPWTADAAGNVLTISGRWSTITGLPEATALGTGWLQKVHDEDRPAIVAAVAEALATSAPLDIKARLQCASGELRWIRSRAYPKKDETGRVLRWYGLSEDVHEQELTLARLRESEEHYRYTVELNPQIPWTADPQGNILDAGPRWTELVGTAPQRWIEALHPDDVEATLESWSHSLRTGARVDLRYRLRGMDGAYRWFRVRAGPRYSETGAILKWYGVVEDIDEQKTAQDRISWSATHDALTQLPNRRLFDTKLAEGLAVSAAMGEGLALFVLDVDHFKHINDTMGHDAGDAVLRALAERLRSTVRPRDTVARLGGDEFALILPGVGTEEEAAAISDRLLERLREPVYFGGAMLDCRASIGASIYPPHGTSAGDLLKHADLALYSSKAGRRGELLIFAPHMRAELQQRVSMTNTARAAVKDDRIRAFYQPKIDLRTGRIAGYEALARWVDSTGQIHLPATIAAAFDDHDVSTALTRTMLGRIVRQMRDWAERGIDFGHVALNVSTADLQRPDFGDAILQFLRSAGIAPGWLQLEVTETVFLARGADRVERSLRTLHNDGIRIALDDFGTGYASLSHLKQFPVDIIKIDRSFVSDIRDDAQQSPIAEAVVMLGKNLGIEVVAEGIETKAQARWLLNVGCHFGQGFLFSPAVPPEELDSLTGAYGPF